MSDAKWRELSNLLTELFAPAGLRVGSPRVAEDPAPHGSGPIPPPVASPGQKLVLFTEHRDTLEYLRLRIGTLHGRPEAIAAIHGGMGRAERRRAQETCLMRKYPIFLHWQESSHLNRSFSEQRRR